MNIYIDQIYNEGLGKTVYTPIKKFIDNKIKKVKTNQILTLSLKIIYALLVISIGILYVYISWPI